MSPPPSAGLSSFATLLNDVLRIRFAPSRSIVILSVTPSPAATSLTRLNSPTCGPSAVGTVYSTLSPSNAFGVSPSVVKLMLPPTPKAAYSSWKFSFTLRNDSRILSPVPSLPSTPVSYTHLTLPTN